MRVAELAQDRALDAQVAQRELLVLGAALRLEHLCRHRRAAPPRFEDVPERTGADLLDQLDLVPRRLRRVHREQRAAGHRVVARRLGHPALREHLRRRRRRLAAHAARVDERLRDVGVAVPLGVVQRRAAPAVGEARLRARREQQRHHLEVAVARRQMQRGPAVVVLGQVAQRIVVQHLAHLLHVAGGGGRRQLDRRLLRRHAELTAGGAQQLRDLGVAVPQRVVERRAAPPVGAELRAVLVEQQLDDGELALRAGYVQRRALVVVAEVDELRLLFEHQLDRRHVRLGDGIEQGRASLLGADQLHVQR